MTEGNQSTELPENPEEISAIEESKPVERTRPKTGEVTITLRRWHLYAFVMPLIFIVGLGLGFLVRGWVPLPGTPAVAASGEVASSDPAAVAAQSNPAAPVETPQVVRYDVPVDDDPSLGSEDAPITIIEFSDSRSYWIPTGIKFALFIATFRSIAFMPMPDQLRRRLTALMNRESFGIITISCSVWSLA
jgi:hypothetical protein